MLGAIIGDIVGSRWEFNPTNDYNFELFSEKTVACSHNHPEAIKGAQSIAWTMYCAVKTFDGVSWSMENTTMI